MVSAVQGFAGPGRVSPASVDREGNRHLVDAAAATGAAMVLVSVIGAAPESPMELFRAKHAAEEHLRGAGIPWTVVRASSFVELWGEILAKAPVLGRGENPINFVAVDDVAAAVELACVDATVRARTLEIGGPENLTFNALARLLAELRGETPSIRHVPRGILRALAPMSRRARAALTMDTDDMTFDAASARSGLPDLPFRSVRQLLATSGPTDAAHPR